MKKTVLLSGFLAISFIFFGCPQVTMLGQIDKETKLEEAVIKGLVGSVVYFQNNLYACDGNIYVKNADTVRGWSKATAPSGHIVKLAADTDHLYALNRDGSLYTTADGRIWDEISGTPTIQTIFSTGYTENNSNAYILTDEKKYLKLNGATKPVEDNTPKSSIVSGGYYAKEKSIYKQGEDTSSFISVDQTIHSIALSPDKRTLYVATDAGVKSYSTTDRKEIPLPGPNASSLVKSSYNYFAVFAYGNAIYAAPALKGSVGSGVGGLFGYYMPRGNWNVE